MFLLLLLECDEHSVALHDLGVCFINSKVNQMKLQEIVLIVMILGQGRLLP